MAHYIKLIVLGGGALAAIAYMGYALYKRRNIQQQANNHLHAQPREDARSENVRSRRCSYCTRELIGRRITRLYCGHQYHSDCLVQLFVQEGQRRCDCGSPFDQNDLAEIAHNLNNNYDDCSICMDPIDPSDLITLRCNHHFHDECLHTLVQPGYQRQCPNCRRKLVDAEVCTILSRSHQ